MRAKISSAESWVSSATSHAGKAKAAIARARGLAPADIPDLPAALDLAGGEVDALTADLLKATSDLGEARQRNDVLQSEVGTQTDLLNKATTEKNVALARADKLDAQRRSAVGQRNKLLLLALVLLIWIFKKPIIGGLGFVARKFAGIPI